MFDHGKTSVGSACGKLEWFTSASYRFISLEVCLSGQLRQVVCLLLGVKIFRLLDLQAFHPCDSMTLKSKSWVLHITWPQPVSPFWASSLKTCIYMRNKRLCIDLLLLLENTMQHIHNIVCELKLTLAAALNPSQSPECCICTCTSSAFGHVWGPRSYHAGTTHNIFFINVIDVKMLPRHFLRAR